MHFKPTTAFKYILVFLVGIFIVYLLFKNQNFSELIKDLKTANWWWVTISAIVIIISHFFRALRWQIMIVPIASKKPSLFHTFNALMIGYLTNLIIPRAGEITRCAMLSKKENIPITALIGTVIAERIIDLVILLGLILISLFLYSDLILSFLDGLNLNPESYTNQLIWIGILIAVIGLLWLMFRYFKNKSALLKKLFNLANQFKDGLLSIKKVEKPIAFCFYTLVIWMFYILSSYLCFKALQKTSSLDLSAALLTVIAGSFGMIAPIQGGIGAYHFMVTEALALLNINKKTGLEYATIIHAAQTVSVIIFGLIALILEFNFKKINHESEQSETPAKNL